jgi:hypothetical protein
MARTYTYLGEAEVLVPFTLDGPKVVEHGDTVQLADDDESFDGHPLWAAGTAKTPPPAPVVVPDPAPVSDPDEPESQEPTA